MTAGIFFEMYFSCSIARYIYFLSYDVDIRNGVLLIFWKLHVTIVSCVSIHIKNRVRRIIEIKWWSHRSHRSSLLLYLQNWVSLCGNASFNYNCVGFVYSMYRSFSTTGRCCSAILDSHPTFQISRARAPIQFETILTFLANRLQWTINGFNQLVDT